MKSDYDFNTTIVLSPFSFTLLLLKHLVLPPISLILLHSYHHTPVRVVLTYLGFTFGQSFTDERINVCGRLTRGSEIIDMGFGRLRYTWIRTECRNRVYFEDLGEVEFTDSFRPVRRYQVWQ